MGIFSHATRGNLKAGDKADKSRRARARRAERAAEKRRERAARPKRKQVTCRCSAFAFPHRAGSEPGGKPWDLGTNLAREHERKLAEREQVTPHWRKAAGVRRASRRAPSRRAPGRVQRGVGVLERVRRAWDAEDVPF